MKILSLSLLTFTLALPLAAQEKKQVYLPSNPKAAAYILGRLSNKELVQAQRVEPVYIAMLERKGLEAKYREEALEGLAKLHNTDRLAELLAAVERLDQQEPATAAPALADLAALLTKSKAADVAAKKAVLESLLNKAKQPLTRQIAYAGLVAAGGAVDALWQAAAKDNAHLADFIGGLPLVSDAQARSQFQSKVVPLATSAPSPQVQRAAISALPSMRGHEAASFATLAGLISKGTERTLAVRAIEKLPRNFWSKELAGGVAQSIADYAAKVPTDQRTRPEFLEAVRLADELSMLLPAEQGRTIRKVLGGLTVRVLVLKTLHEQMFYDKVRLVVEAGKPVEINFDNTDVMPHNLVIVAPGAREEIGALADKMPQAADEKGLMFVPKSPKVLFATKLVEPGQKTKLNFIAPKELGEYPYVCTFPGHWVRMFGTLVVVNDVEDYLTKNPEPTAPVITEWKVADLTEDLKRLDQHRNFAAGKGFFTTLGCVQCHQLGKEGAAFGPNLTGLFAKWKGDRAAVLEQIIDPNKAIEEKFRNTSLEIGDENSFTGIVLAEDNDTVTIQTGPSTALIQKVKKSDIKSRRAQQLSLMPAGLLDGGGQPGTCRVQAWPLSKQKPAGFRRRALCLRTEITCQPCR
jgi:putative heme-binding domain-containing protein